MTCIDIRNESRNTAACETPCLKVHHAHWASYMGLPSIEYTYSGKKLVHRLFFFSSIFFFFLFSPLLYVSLFQKGEYIKENRSKRAYILCRQLMPYEQKCRAGENEKACSSFIYNKLIAFQAHPHRVKQHLPVL